MNKQAQNKLIEENQDLKKENFELQQDLGMLHDLISELVVDVENGREPEFLDELVEEYRKLFPKD